jgi:GT2 family glycosyltransferase
MLYFIIPEYGFRDKTNACVISIKETFDGHCRIVIGDNGFYHGEQPLPVGELFTYPDNIGYVRTTNQLVRDVAPDPENMLFLCNNDVLFLEDAIAHLNDIASTGALAGPSIIIPAKFLKHVHHAQMQAVRSVLSGIEPLDMLSTCVVALKMSIWNRIGGFDESFRHYYSDDAFSIEAARRGINRFWVRDAWIIHDVGVSFRNRYEAGKQAAKDKAVFEAKYPDVIWTPTGHYGEGSNLCAS